MITYRHSSANARGKKAKPPISLTMEDKLREIGNGWIQVVAYRVAIHASLPNKRIPIYRVDWANQRNDVEDWRPTWDLNWTLIADYHLNKEGLSETEDEIINSHPPLQ